MDMQTAIEQYSPLKSLLTTAEIDAEIREELEFHLHMRTQDNLRAGMTPEEARRDAHERFGDFEASRRACRRITLGPRLVLRRLQTLLLVVLLGTVVYQAVLLFKLQNSNRDEIESLTQLVAQLRNGRETASDDDATMPYIQLNPDPHRDVIVAGNSAKMEVLPGWSTMDDPLRQPWCDWRTLEMQTEYD